MFLRYVGDTQYNKYIEIKEKIVVIVCKAMLFSLERDLSNQLILNICFEFHIIFYNMNFFIILF